jgi:hypothetical protein
MTYAQIYAQETRNQNKPSKTNIYLIDCFSAYYLDTGNYRNHKVNFPHSPRNAMQIWAPHCRAAFLRDGAPVESLLS